MYFFTADEHYWHKKVLLYCNRPYLSIEEMNQDLVSKFNSVVGKNDTTIHAGDFCFGKKEQAQEIIKQLNGNHIFLKGSHDHWLPDSAKYIWRTTIEGQFIMVCHYAMRTWERCHYNSWHLYGHSHGRLEPFGKAMDIGVDCNSFYPFSWEFIKGIMRTRPDNFNLVQKEKEDGVGKFRTT